MEVARATDTRRAVAGTVQHRFEWAGTDRDYVSAKGWEQARPPPRCGHCKQDRCPMAGHGTYERIQPPGCRVRRYRCQRSGRTAGMLPDCLASHMKGSLDDVECVQEVWEESGGRLLETAGCP